MTETENQKYIKFLMTLPKYQIASLYASAKPKAEAYDKICEFLREILEDDFEAKKEDD